VVVTENTAAAGRSSNGGGGGRGGRGNRGGRDGGGSVGGDCGGGGGGSGNGNGAAASVGTGMGSGAGTTESVAEQQGWGVQSAATNMVGSGMAQSTTASVAEQQGWGAQTSGSGGGGGDNIDEPASPPAVVGGTRSDGSVGRPETSVPFVPASYASPQASRGGENGGGQRRNRRYIDGDSSVLSTDHTGNNTGNNMGNNEYPAGESEAMAAMRPWGNVPDQRDTRGRHSGRTPGNRSNMGRGGGRGGGGGGGRGGHGGHGSNGGHQGMMGDDGGRGGGPMDGMDGGPVDMSQLYPGTVAMMITPDGPMPFLITPEGAVPLHGEPGMGGQGMGGQGMGSNMAPPPGFMMPGQGHAPGGLHGPGGPGLPGMRPMSPMSPMGGPRMGGPISHMSPAGPSQGGGHGGPPPGFGQPFSPPHGGTHIVYTRVRCVCAPSSRVSLILLSACAVVVWLTSPLQYTQIVRYDACSFEVAIRSLPAVSSLFGKSLTLINLSHTHQHLTPHHTRTPIH
jgi:hypothetical protein